MGNRKSRICENDEIGNKSNSAMNEESLILEYCKKAKQMVMGGNLNEAMKLIEEYVSIFPNSGLLLRMQAGICFEMADSMTGKDSVVEKEHMSKAIRLAKQAAGLCPNSIEFSHFLIRLLIQNCEFERAVQEARKALSILHPDDHVPQASIDDLKQSIRDFIRDIQVKESPKTDDVKNQVEIDDEKNKDCFMVKKTQLVKSGDQNKDNAMMTFLAAITVLGGFISTLYLGSGCTILGFLIGLGVAIVLGIMVFARITWLKLLRYDAEDIETSGGAGSVMEPLMETKGRENWWYYMGILAISLCALLFIGFLCVAYYAKCKATSSVLYGLK